MKKVTNECVQCGLPCMRECCPHYRVTRYYCDCCKEECETLYHFDGQELCIDCIEKELEEVV